MTRNDPLTAQLSDALLWLKQEARLVGSLFTTAVGRYGKRISCSMS